MSPEKGSEPQEGLWPNGLSHAFCLWMGWHLIRWQSSQPGSLSALFPWHWFFHGCWHAGSRSFQHLVTTTLAGSCLGRLLVHPCLCLGGHGSTSSSSSVGWPSRALAFLPCLETAWCHSTVSMNFISLVTSCVGLQEEEPQTSHHMSVIYSC